MGLDFLVPIFGILLVLVPVTGLTVVLVSKYAVRHIVDALTQIRGNVPDGRGVGLQIQELSDQVEVLTAEVRRLRDSHDFDRKLLGKDPSAPGTPPA